MSKKIFSDSELQEDSVIRKFRISGFMMTVAGKAIKKACSVRKECDCSYKSGFVGAIDENY